MNGIEWITYIVNSDPLYTASTHEVLFCYKENTLVLTLNFDNSPGSVPKLFPLDNSCCNDT